MVAATPTGIPWYYWALLTVICWGTYGVCMHTGSANMKSPEHGRLMAFLWVGLAYFLTAVIAPLIILKLKGASIEFWNFPTKGWRTCAPRPPRWKPAFNVWGSWWTGMGRTPFSPAWPVLRSRRRTKPRLGFGLSLKAHTASRTIWTATASTQRRYQYLLR